MRGLWLAAVGANALAGNYSGRPLAYAESDARHAYAALSAQTAYEMRGRLILDNHVYVRDLRTTLGELLGKATTNDDVIIYYAGHGIVEQTPRGPQLFLGIHGTKMEDVVATSLGVADLSRAMETSKAGTCTLILDCCFSGNATGRSLFGPAYLATLAQGRRLRRKAPNIAGEGRLLLGAAGKNKIAHESSVLKSGIFTYYLLRVLNAHRGESTITFARLHADLLESMNRATQGEQLPYVSGDNNGAAFPTTPWRLEAQ